MAKQTKNRSFRTDRTLHPDYQTSNTYSIGICNHEYEINEMIIRQSNSDGADIKKHFDSASVKIYEEEKNYGATLVHCVAGISRSASLVLAYLMKYKKMTLRQAHDFLKSKRRIIRPNNGFWMQLIEYERQLFGKNTVEMVSCPAVQADGQPLDDVKIPDIYKDEYKDMVIVKDFKKLF